MMYGAKSLKCLVNPIETRYAPEAKMLASRTIAANWQALTFHHVPKVPVHVPAALPQHAAPSRLEHATEAMAREWMAREDIVATFKLRGRKAIRKAGGNKHRLPMAHVVPPSQLWPAEVRALRVGFQAFDPAKGSGKYADATKLTIEEIARTYQNG